MEIYHQAQDQPVFGRLVADFPQGVGAAFSDLMKMLSGKDRSYYGISRIDENGKIEYYAAAAEQLQGEAEKYDCLRLLVPKGNYLAEKVVNWKENTACIKDVFHKMMQEKKADGSKPCIEWYYADTEMLCMLQETPGEELFAAVDDAAAQLLELPGTLSNEELNRIPFPGSWTAAQLLVHVIKSNNAITQAMDLGGTAPQRNSTERVQELKDIFLNFTHKLKSPSFIDPGTAQYEKEQTIAALKRSNENMKEKRGQTDLSEVISFSAFGQITKLELLHFVLYHTQRHIQQLKNIVQRLK